MLCSCSTSGPEIPDGVMVAADAPLDFEGTLKAQEQIIRIQRDQIGRQEREILELRRQAEVNKRTESYAPKEE